MRFSMPTVRQEQLLRAALVRGPEGTRSWDAWREGSDVAALDSDSQWLLPLLYHNLRVQGIAAPLLVRYRNVYLHNWYKNNVTLRRAEHALGRFRKANGSVILLQGLAMALSHYATPGVRPFERLQVLADRPAGSMPAVGDPDEIIDIRSTLFDGEVDAIVTARTSEVRWMSNRWLVLDPADQLVDICVRHEEWDRRSTLLWVADAATVVGRHPDLNWDSVMDIANRLNRRADVGRALAYLDERIGISIPGSVRRTLAHEVPA